MQIQRKRAVKTAKVAAPILTLLIAAVSVFALGFGQVFAVGRANPKATGGVGYEAYSLQRYADFNAQQTNTACAVNVSGNWKVDFALSDSTHNPSLYDLSLTQTEASLTGTGQYPSPGPYQYARDATGAISGNTVNLTAVYTLGAVGATMQMTGSVQADGSLAGTWTDNFDGSRSGTWATTSASTATAMVTGCDGKGLFHYSDVNGAWYDVDVKYVHVMGDSTWFAGPVVAGSVGSGNWLSAKVQDGGTPGTSGDQIWGSFTTEAQAKLWVALMQNPSDGAFAINSGNLVVH